MTLYANHVIHLLTNVNIVLKIKNIFTKVQSFIIEKSMKTVTVGVRMTPEMRDKLQGMADKDMRSLSNLVLKILTEYLLEHEKKSSEPEET